MKLRFYVAGSKLRELEVAEAVGDGVRAFGDEFEIADAGKFTEPSGDVDVACVFALKGHAKPILTAYRAMGARTLLFDKGLIRAGTGMGAPSGYFRVSIDEFMPLGRMTREMWPPHRWIEAGMVPAHRVPFSAGSPIIYAGSSQKYCDYHDLGDATEYAGRIIRTIRKSGIGRPIIYRPKPSWDAAVPIDGTTFSRLPERLGELLKDAHALVTHGSHAAIDAILAGVPAVVLGHGAARPVAMTSLGELNTSTLYFPSRKERGRWLSALAWWQWRVTEMQDGSMWKFLRDEMEKPAS